MLTHCGKITLSPVFGWDFRLPSFSSFKQRIEMWAIFPPNEVPGKGQERFILEE